jgi:hypothetical protein
MLWGQGPIQHGGHRGLEKSYLARNRTLDIGRTVLTIPIETHCLLLLLLILLLLLLLLLLSTSHFSPSAAATVYMLVYTRTYARAGPYLIGIALGYVLHVLRNKHVRVPMVSYY